MKTLRRFACVFALLGLAATAGGCIIDSDDDDDGPVDGSLLVDNQSDFAIVEIRVTPVGSSSWGPNLLRGDILLPGDTLTLGVECDLYDAMLVDEDNETCTLSAVDLCLNDADWIIRNNTCVVFEAKAKAKAEAAAKGPGSSVAPAPAL